MAKFGPRHAQFLGDDAGLDMTGSAASAVARLQLPHTRLGHAQFTAYERIAKQNQRITGGYLLLVADLE